MGGTFREFILLKINQFLSLIFVHKQFFQIKFKLFYEKHGHVPVGTDTLGNWIREQRRKYQNNKLSSRQIERLEELNVSLVPRSDVGRNININEYVVDPDAPPMKMKHWLSKYVSCML